ncbi:MAG: membrane-bound lytic murein transglycosylase F [Cyclobacteriaceae bacterium]|jgi:membrane-bound lytic murein transglycosylase F
MQLLPTTGQEYGVTNLKDPSLNLYAGRSHILWLDDLWKEMVDDPNERLKFVLASYNVGHGHVRDARKLAKKYDVDPNDWTEVSEYLLKKSNPAYFNDPVVEFGYCRGIEPVQYVEIILDTYETYQAMFPDDEQAN